MKRAILSLLVLALLSPTLFAQGVTSAAMSGLVTDANGLAVVGANITAVHEPSGSRYGNVSREDGQYNISNLRPGGPYTVKVSLIGYADKERKNVFVQLGDNFRLNFSISEQAVEAAEVVIVGEGNSVFSANKMGSGNVVTSKDMDKVPTISRNFEDFYKLSPYFSGSNAAGKNKGYNNIQIDGANYNDLFGLGGTTPGSQSRATPISLDAIEQFQLEVSPYDVRKAGFTGAGINAVTRSGGNALTGSAYIYGRNQGMIGVSPDAFDKEFAEFTDYQAGFRIGGPIMQNEMFFFVNGEIQRNTTPTVRTFGASTQTTNVFTLPKDTLSKMLSILKNKYGYDAGTFDEFDMRQNSDKMFARLDWNITDEHRLTLRHSYLSALLDNTPSRGRGATDIFATNHRYVVENTTNSTALLFKSTLGNTLANEFIVGLTLQYDKPKILGSPFPAIFLETSAPDAKTYTVLAGAEQFRHRNELDQEVLEISNNTTYFMGDHTITAGLRLESFSFRNLFLPNNFGTYRFTSLYHLENGLVKSGSYEYQYSLNGDNTYAIKWTAITYGGYIQDEWQVDANLRLNGGIRFDIPTYTVKPAYNYKVDSTFGPRGFDIATDKVPATYVQLSPRFGFNYTLDDERTTQIRGGAGIFSGRVPYVWVSNQYGNTGVEYGRLTGTPAFSANPFAQPGPGTLGFNQTTAYEIDITDPNFKNPSILRYSLSVDQKLPMDMTATAEVIMAKTLNEVTYQNINLKGVVDTVGNEGRPVYSTSSANRNINSTFTSVMYLKNTDQGGQSSYSLQLNRTGAEDNIDFTGGYVFNSSEDINSGASAQAFSQWRFNPISTNPNEAVLTNSIWNRDHRFYLSVSYTYDWNEDLATDVGFFFNAQSGRGFSYVVDGDVNGDGANGNDLAYIPEDINDITLVTSSGTVLAKTDVAYTNLFKFIDNDEYLKENKGKFAERAGAVEPWSYQLDFRVTQHVGFMGQKLEVYFNILNVMNLIDKENGHVKEVPNQSANLFRYHSFDAATNTARYVYTNPVDPRQPNDILSRYQMQLGMRYSF